MAQKKKKTDIKYGFYTKVQVANLGEESSGPGSEITLNSFS